MHRSGGLQDFFSSDNTATMNDREVDVVPEVTEVTVESTTVAITETVAPESAEPVDEPDVEAEARDESMTGSHMTSTPFHVGETSFVIPTSPVMEEVDDDPAPVVETVRRSHPAPVKAAPVIIRMERRQSGRTARPTKRLADEMSEETRLNNYARGRTGSRQPPASQSKKGKISNLNY